MLDWKRSFQTGNRMRGSILLGLIGLLGAEAALACPACGDKLNFGGGMGFERRPAAQTVGHVAVLSPPGSAEGVPVAAAQISSLLEKDGHHVEVAVDAAALQQSQGQHPIDVVIVHWPQAANAAQLFDGIEGAPTVLAVAYDADDAAAAKSVATAGCFARVDQRRGRKLVEAVTKVIEQRAKGTPPQCSVTVAQQQTE
jgi:CheY-like chemotaxis protein